ncbi:MAG TPA: phosphatidate cytidylyltransferase [Xanthobacteraceae bacterium]|nr:phosphatidate cytidylyltransferase [Xanthobacteraceae bacterium]
MKPRDLLSPAATGTSLTLRILSAVVLAPFALGTAYLGGIVFLTFWAVAALGVLWEWDSLVCTRDRNAVFVMGALTIVGGAVLWELGRMVPAVILTGLGVLGVATLASSSRRVWCVVGLVCAGMLLYASAVLRRDPAYGLTAILFLFAVVWLTDIVAYFIGRAVGGPKLAPNISPNKTWSGAVGGLVGGLAGGMFVAILTGMVNIAALAAVAAALSAAAQIGDLAESAMKRQFNVKDTSGLIPGHGGLMDRLDGFFAAAVVAVTIGLVREGLDSPGRGLLFW